MTSAAGERKTRSAPPGFLRVPSVAGMRRFRRSTSAVLGLLLTSSFVLMALLAPLIAGDPIAFDLSRQLRPPSATHPLGTDELGGTF